jgi:flagellar hook-length control protein FliK
LPRLRESFSDSGIQLADAEVGQQMEQQQQQHDENSGQESNIIFSQEMRDDDDIEIEDKIEQDNVMGLSLYA